MTPEEMKEKINGLWNDYRNAKTKEDVNLIAEKWVKLGQGNLSSEEKTEYSRFLRYIGQGTGSSGKFDCFNGYLKDLPFEKSVNVADNLQSLAYMDLYLGYLVEKKTVPQDIKKETIRKIEKLIENEQKLHWYGREEFYASIKNFEFSKDSREKVNSRLTPEDMVDLHPKFHDLNTIKALAKYSYNYNSLDSKALDAFKSIFEYVTNDNNDSAYYRLLGSKIGKKPSTQIECVDAIIDRICEDDNARKRNFEEVRKHFIKRDILAGRGDSLKREDIESVMQESGSIVLMEKLSAEKISEFYYRISKPDLKLAAITKLMSVKDKETSYYQSLLRDGREKLKELPQSKQAQEFMAVAKEFIENYSKSDDVIKAKAKKIENEQARAEDKEHSKSLREAQSGVYTLEEIQGFWTKIEENTAKGQKGVSKEEVNAVINQAIESKGENGVGLRYPQPKLPLLFGRKKAKEQQRRLENLISQLNKVLTDKNKMANLANLKVVDVLDEKVLKTLNNEKTKREKVSQESWKRVRDSELEWREKCDLEDEQRFNELGEKIDKAKAFGDEETSAKLVALRGLQEDKMTEASDERGKKRAERKQPPKTAKDKEEAAKEAYQKRKKAVKDAGTLFVSNNRYRM